MIAAVRTDAGALASPRVIETIRRWQERARDAGDPDAQRAAKQRLRAVAAAIARDGAPERIPSSFAGDGDATEAADGIEDVYTVDSYRPGDPPDDPLEPGDGSDTTPKQEVFRAPPSREFAEEDEKPTTLRDSGANPVASRSPGLYRAARIDPFKDEDEKPTAPIPMPKLPDAGAAENADPQAGARLAPKPGIVRRHSPRIAPKKDSLDRPRAAMQPVKALYAIVLPLCEELIPLGVERRSRRFWARWREVAGDRGVRRDFIDALLVNANDLRTMVCELIAEVQTVDLNSVHALVQKIEADEAPSPPRPARPPKSGATQDRHRGPVVGAEVRVEGVEEE